MALSYHNEPLRIIHNHIILILLTEYCGYYNTNFCFKVKHVSMPFQKCLGSVFCMRAVMTVLNTYSNRDKSFKVSFWNFLSTFIFFLQQAVFIKWQPFEFHTYSGSTQQPCLQTNDSPLRRIFAKYLPDKNCSVILSHCGELWGDLNVNASTDLHKKLREMYQLEHQRSIFMWHSAWERWEGGGIPPKWWLTQVQNISTGEKLLLCWFGNLFRLFCLLVWLFLVFVLAFLASFLGGGLFFFCFAFFECERFFVISF